MEIEQIIRELRRISKLTNCLSSFDCQTIKFAADKLSQESTVKGSEITAILREQQARIEELLKENQILDRALHDGNAPGYWVRRKKSAVCFCIMCGHEEMFYGYHPHDFGYNFCPHCGARMRMEVQDDDKHAEDHIDRDKA